MIDPDGNRLDAGDPFPRMTLSLPGGREIHVPDEFDHPYQAILFYRGHWCPYCQTQLKSYQTGLPNLEAAGIGVIAASVDEEKHSVSTVESLGLTFPVAHGLPAVETARTIGGYYDATPRGRAPYLQSTGFVLGPDRRILLAVYSSGAIGRLGWQDVIGMVEYAQKSKSA